MLPQGNKKILQRLQFHIDNNAGITTLSIPALLIII
jgi:hypothetical protein